MTDDSLFSSQKKTVGQPNGALEGGYIWTLATWHKHTVSFGT